MPVLTVNQLKSIDTITPASQASFTVSAAAMETAAPNSTGTLVAAKTGNLTTRTNATDGTLTMDSGHGITTGQRLDIFWSGGQGYGATVGTVSGDSVPFTGLVGTLPDDESEITAQVPTQVNISVTGNDCKFIVVTAALTTGDYGCNVIITRSDNTVSEAYQLTGAIPADGWNGSTYGPANPISGETVAKVFFAQGNSTKTVQAYAYLGYTS